MFRELIEEAMHQRPTLSLDRTAPDEAQRAQDKSAIVEHVTDGLSRQLEAMGGAVDQPSVDPERDFGDLGGVADLRRHVREMLVMGNLADLGLTLHPPLFVGDLHYGPPYADDFQEGGGFAFGAVNDGSVTTFGSHGFSMAGISLYLTSNTSQLVSASITPEGTYQWSWSSFENLPSLQSRGGLGISVFQGSQELMRREVILWTQAGAQQFSGNSGTGQIADAASPAFGFGTVPLAPVIMNMSPGVQYLVSVWAWQVAQYPEGAAFLAFMNMKMPSVKVSLGDPFIGPH